MLEGLDQIDWASLHHAYGPATDVPALLRDLASSELSRVDVAIYDLFGNIWHQHTVYEASAYAVPFLIELVQNRSVLKRPMILILLASLATGSSYLAVHQGIQGMRPERGTAAFDEKLQRELAWVRAAHEAVAEGIPAFVALLRDPDEEVAACAAYTLSCFPERGVEISPALRAGLATDLPLAIESSVILSMGMFNDRHSGHAKLFEDIFDSAAADPTRLAAALALARAWRDVAPERAAGVLGVVAQNPGWDTPVFPWVDTSYEAPGSTFERLESALAQQNLSHLWETGDWIHDYVCAP